MIGRTLSRYRILAGLGQGGMGVVYRAHDDRLDRDVAIKVLPPGALSDETARRRFHREALALSKLNHPGIGTIYDFDSQDGIDFLVMELVAGETLAARIARGPVSEDEVVVLGTQIAEALEAAHRRGVVHRDLKPENVVVTPDGHVKVLDFGVAKLLQPSGAPVTTRLTQTQELMGTLPYMAPEQLLGREVDERADLFSLGVMFYEMATGRLPFAAETAYAVANLIMNEQPRPPGEVSPSLSPWLSAVTLRCLEKHPEARYSSATTLLEALKSRTVPRLPPAAGRARGRFPARGRRAWATAIAAVAMIAGAFALLRALNTGGLRSPGAKRIESLAVLPLVNLSHDPEQDYFADGMTEELINRLAQISALRVRPRLSVLPYKSSRQTLPTIARKLRVEALVTGSVLRSGRRARISAQLIRAADEVNLWADTFEGDVQDVLALQSQVARAVAEKIQVKLSSPEHAALATSRQVDPKVNDAYLKGRYYMTQHSEQGCRSAIQQFNEAISIDPVFAPAYAGLADAYTLISSLYMAAREAMPRAKAAAMRALVIDSTVAEAYSALAYVRAFYDWDWKEAEPLYRKAIELQPGSDVTHRDYMYYLYTVRRFNEALEEQRRAAEIDPLSTNLRAVKGTILLYARRYDEAITLLEGVAKDDPNHHVTYLVLAQCYLLKRNYAAALAALKEASRVEDNTFALAWLGYTHAVMGDRRAAKAVLGRMKDRSRTEFVQPFLFALPCVGLDDKEQAFEWLEKGIEERSEEMCTIPNLPAMDPLRSDPRFAQVLRRLGFPT